MGEGPFGDSDASVEACRDRDLSEWGGMGLLEAKIFGTAHFRCTQGSCGTRRRAWGMLRTRRGRYPGPPYFTICLFSPPRSAINPL
jgi:hypothetical protein